MADRTATKNALPDKLKDVNAALVHMNEVITGGAFDENQIWGSNAVADIPGYMRGLTVYADLKTTIGALLKDVPTGAVSQAITTAMTGLEKVLQEIQKQADELGVQSRLDAFKRLNGAHSSDPAYDFQPAAAGNFGFIPAIAGVVGAVTGSTPQTDEIMGPLNKIADLAALGEGIVDFTAFAAASIELLGRTLKTV
ncbi:hypothetical protein E5161_07190 [Cohnella pontilimi]|uniref:Uncharacterized protein n=1 Tax=Cohnella pontilimi TaxID=2564100 RepID=A0A4U0FCZ7_9BACL|nr:hypothetical protein [Cohnella pontilimi]TJY42630.1 hypothetical protein E5161_07190 [Cohnella pontilimi]